MSHYTINPNESFDEEDLDNPKGLNRKLELYAGNWYIETARTWG